MAPLEIPEVVIDRLPVYFRLLASIRASGQSVVSSQELGEALGVTSAQIRKDLSYFGRFGKQGRGYSVERLTDELALILGLDRRWRLIVAGMGRLGQAIAAYHGFEPQGFDIAAVYDTSAAVIGTERAGMIVRDAEALHDDIVANPIDLAIIAVPAEEAQAVIDTLVEAGVRAILNYAPVAVQVPQGVHVRQIDPVVQLQSMTYHLSQALAASAGAAARSG